MNATERTIIAALLRIVADLDVDDLLRVLSYAAHLRDDQREAHNRAVLVKHSR